MAKAAPVCLLRLLYFLLRGYSKGELTDARRRKISAAQPKHLKLVLQHIGSSLLQEVRLHRTPVCEYTRYLTFSGPCIVSIFVLIYFQRDETLHSLFLSGKLLYMFRVVSSPIIRSTYNCIYSIWYLLTITANCLYCGRPAPTLPQYRHIAVMVNKCQIL